MALTLAWLARLRHIVAVRHRGFEGFRLTGQKGLHFMLHDFQSSMVDGQVMEQQHGQPALIGLVFADHQQQQRCLTDIQTVITRVEARLELRQHFSFFQFRRNILNTQLRFAPDHLHRLFQAFPDKGRAQNVMPVDHALQGADEVAQTLATDQGEFVLQDIGVAPLGRQVMVENPLLQRCQRVDILHIGRTARNAGHDPVDGDLVQGKQRQHIRRDALTALDNAVFGHCLQALQSSGIRTVLDRLDQQRLVFTQQGQDSRLGQRLFTTAYSQLVTRDGELYAFFFQYCQQFNQIHRKISVFSVAAAYLARVGCSNRVLTSASIPA
ncbi:hypothetical protein PSCICJ_04370 [Pseudomonas cichorii]|nr:hypothetical protein PSCICJ_04370 [Pseudomonas cichorii]